MRKCRHGTQDLPMVEAGGSALDSGVGVVDGRNQACQVRSSRTEPIGDCQCRCDAGRRGGSVMRARLSCIRRAGSVERPSWRRERETTTEWCGQLLQVSGTSCKVPLPCDPPARHASRLGVARLTHTRECWMATKGALLPKHRQPRPQSEDLSQDHWRSGRPGRHVRGQTESRIGNGRPQVRRL